jgi:aminopeptidase N
VFREHRHALVVCRLASAFLLLFLSLVEASAMPALTAGVSRELAAWRAERYGDLRYRIHGRVEPDLQAIVFSVEISVRIGWVDGPLVLDWRPAASGSGELAVQVNGVSRSVPVVQEHVIVDAPELHAGMNTLSYTVTTPVAVAGAAITRFRDTADSADYLYSVFVPADARTVLPLFDQPDLKARFAFSLDVADGWTVISNASAGRIDPVPAGRTTYRFLETEPISTYLFAFAAGPFAELRVPEDPVRAFVRRSRAPSARTQVTEILRLNRKATHWLEAWLDRPFPFPKYDLVLIPEFPFGGMEHAGATFLRETTVLLPGVPSSAETFRRAHLLFHELSHQWVGDLVTMRWFDDLWLKEGFANYLATRIAADLLPESDAWVAFHARKSEGYRIDGLKGGVAVRQALGNLRDAKSVYGPVAYEKAPALLRQAEFLLGEPSFRAGVSAWIQANAWRTSDWRDLVGFLERAAGLDLSAWAEAWVNTAGMPEVRARWRAHGGRIASFTVSARDVSGGRAAWPQRLRLRLFFPGDATRDVTVQLEHPETGVPELVGEQVPEVVLINADDFGYGRFRLRNEDVGRAFDYARSASRAIDRALLWEALWEEVRDAELSPATFVERAIGAIGTEPDPLLESQLLARLETAWVSWTDGAERNRLAATLEGALSSRFERPGEAAARLGALRAYVALASSPAALARLQAWVRGEDPPVPWNPRDRFLAARTLLVREWPGARADLARLTTVLNDDDSRRFHYAAGAADGDPRVKARYFASWSAGTGVPEVPEAWIEEALPAFNAPDQASLTLPWFEQAINLLPTLKAERKIFFVNRWLDAFVQGQGTERALEILRATAGNGGIEEDLRNKLLLAEDRLRRTVRIRQRWAHEP